MTEEMRRRRRTAIRREMTERHENRGGTQGLVDEGPHSWMVQGDKRGCWAMKGPGLTGRRQCNRACRDENLLPVTLQIALLHVLHAEVGEAADREAACV